MSGNCNDNHFKPLSSVDWMATMVPEVVESPATIFYIHGVVVKILICCRLAVKMVPTLHVGTASSPNI